MDIQLQKNIRYLIHSLPVKDSLSVTLTMRQVVEYDYLDPIKASKNFTHFLNRLNKKVYGNAYKRFGKSVSVVPVLEKSIESRYHFHLILEKPKHIPQNTYELMITECWRRTKFGYYEIDIRNIYSSGWSDYITKFASIDDAIDWENYHWNS